MKPYDWRKMKTIEGLPAAAPKKCVCMHADSIYQSLFSNN